jgi:hypothetical protein
VETAEEKVAELLKERDERQKVKELEMEDLQAKIRGSEELQALRTKLPRSACSCYCPLGSRGRGRCP